MRIRTGSWALCAVMAGVLASSVRADPNGIFPPQPAAQQAITWKDGFFVINGRPTFLAAGEIHYARVPRELWKDRILRVKAMGFNTIQMYCMWNAHEGKEGEFDFSGPLDLDAFLATIQECGMYAIVRPGPYVCAEWENGGLPAWLCSKPGMRVRTNHPEYLRYVDRYMARIYQIVGPRQIHKGGNVLMLQLENELPNTWGTDTNAYTRHMYDQARAAGLEIPLFNSGLHHGNDPAGNNPFPQRDMPWYSTEFWTGWIGLSGEMDAQMFQQKVRGTWKIIAFGGAGYDYYVVHGGTNFGYSKGVEVTASYDYASPIGEAGQLRRVYFPMKRAGMFATAFDEVLTAARNTPGAASATAQGVQTYVRAGPAGTAVFLDAGTGGGARGGRGGRGAAAGAGAPPATGILTQVRLADGRVIPSGDRQLRLAPGEIRPILTNVRIHQDQAAAPAAEVVFEYAATGVLTRRKIGPTTYVVCYGAAGDEGEVLVKGQARPLVFTYPQGDEHVVVDVPGTNVKLLVMNTTLADRTWVAGDALIVGPNYVSPEGDVYSSGGPATVYSAQGRTQRLLSMPSPPQVALPVLSSWTMREGAREALPGTDTSRWASSPQPLAMEQYDSYQNGWGWYRTTVRRDRAQTVTMRFSGAGDVLRIFLNGQRVAGDRGGATLALRAGDNDIAVLCWNEGRPKMYNFVGPTGMLNARGIWGPVQLIDTPIASIRDWRAQDTTAANNAPAAADFDDSAWSQVRMTSNIMNNRVGYAWFRSTFEIPAGTTEVALFHQGIDDEGEIFVNGEFVGKHVGYNSPGSFDLAKFIKPGRNVLAIRLRNNDGAGGIPQPIDIVAMKGQITGWKFQPGVGGLDETPLLGKVRNWEAFLATPPPTVREGQRPPQLPTLHSATFTYTPNPQIARTFRLRTTGLRAGSVWVNGHNLGPYRNTGNNAALMYVPECWLQGTNTVVIFDAEGASPAQVALEAIETFVRASIR